MLTTERGKNLSARNETVVRKACQPSWGGLKILQSPCVLLIQKKKKKKIVGKNQLQCPAELIVPRQSIIISVASCFPSISSLSSLQHSSLCFSSVLLPHSLLLHHLGYCVSFHD